MVSLSLVDDRSCEYEPGQAQQGHIHRSKESDQILTGRESPSLLSSLFFLWRHRNVGNEPCPAAIMEFSSCRAWHFGVRSSVQIKWPDGIWSLAVNEIRCGRLLHPILRVYPISWMTRQNASLGPLREDSSKRRSPGLVNFVPAVAYQTSASSCLQHSHNLEDRLEPISVSGEMKVGSSQKSYEKFRKLF